MSCPPTFTSLSEKALYIIIQSLTHSSKGTMGMLENLKLSSTWVQFSRPSVKGVSKYTRDKLVELQETFDELDSKGVIARPEDVAVVVEYLNPSFLVKKPNGGHCFVTAFAEDGRYCKPSFALLPNVDSTLRQIACWKYITGTDLTNA